MRGVGTVGCVGRLGVGCVGQFFYFNILKGGFYSPAKTFPSECLFPDRATEVLLSFLKVTQ